MAKQRADIKDKMWERLKDGPANIKILSLAANCTRQTARIHITELERDSAVKSYDLGNQKVYWLP